MNPKPGPGYLSQRIAEGEHLQQDFKFGITDSRKIARSLVAFANTIGGRLLIGVKDNGSIVGVKSEEEYYMIESAATIFCIPEVGFSSRSIIENGKKVFEVRVPESKHKPHYVKESANRLQAYFRQHDENRLASEVRVAIWNKEKIASGQLIRISQAETLIFESLRQRRTLTMNEIQRITGLDYPTLTDTISNLIIFENIDLLMLDGQECFGLK